MCGHEARACPEQGAASIIRLQASRHRSGGSHAANVAPVTSFLNNVYEGLVRRGPDMQIEPSLAT